VGGLVQAGRVAKATVALAQLVLGAFLIIGLGVWLIVDPNVRGPRFTLKAIWPGLAAITAGLGLLGLLVWQIKRGIREAHAQARASQAQEPPLQGADTEPLGPQGPG
jgi:hypothetical protein